MGFFNWPLFCFVVFIFIPQCFGDKIDNILERVKTVEEQNSDLETKVALQNLKTSSNLNQMISIHDEIKNALQDMKANYSNQLISYHDQIENKLLEMMETFSDFGTRVQCKEEFRGPNCETCSAGYFNFPTCAGQ